jgi:hypothetical protein
MKLNFVKSIGRLRTKPLPVLFGLLLSPLFGMMAYSQTEPLFSNTGAIVGNPPNVDATSFYNSGTWDILTSYLPYQTRNTLNYTNTGIAPTSGLMVGSVGWEFDYGPLVPNGGRGWSANFFNDNGSKIQAVDGINPNPTTPPLTTEASYLLVSATNIVNKGTLLAGAAGEIVLNGSNVNLARGGLGITSIVGAGSGNNFNQGNFAPDTSIYDEYWAQAGLTNMDSASIWNGNNASTPDYPPIIVNAPCEPPNDQISFGFSPSLADSLSLTNMNSLTNIVVTNMDGSTTSYLEPTNIFRQAVFVAIDDPNISGQIKFSPQAFPPDPSNLFETVTVQLGMTATDPVTGSSVSSTLYLVDTLGSSTNRGLLLNNNYVPGSNPESPCTDPTFRPGNYLLSRTDPGFGGASGDGPPTNNFLYDTSFTNQFVIAVDAAYSAYIDNLTFDPYGGAVTNLPGRLNINAGNLDLTKTRISAQGLVTIQSTNLIGSTNAVVDCQNVSYNFGSAAGNLNVTNLAKPFVSRLNGTIYAWSGLWTNVMIQVFTNYASSNVITMGVTNVVYYYSPLTNSVEMLFHTLVLDAGQLSSTVPVTVQDLVLQPSSTNMVVSDDMTVARTLLLGGQSFTLQGGLILSGVLENWTSANAPNLRYFTNNGVLDIPNDAHFGDDGPTNYAEFINNGTIAAGSETINSVDFQAGGSENVNGRFFATASTAKVQNGSINSGADVQFNAGTLKFNAGAVTAGGQLYLNVANSLFDTGGSSGNVLTCNNGFDLPVKPTTGDLLGTELETITPAFAAVDHYWAGLDRGVSSAGYSNNVALGQLVLVEGGSDSATNASEFSFHATGSSNAVYVDLLDLSQCPDFLDPSVLTIDPNFVIYYAAVKLPSTFTIPPNGSGVSQEAEEFMNGQLGGHLRWVSSFAGPNSSVDVISNGVTIVVNKALRYSKIIDSNGDGVPNYYDPYPFSTSAPFIVAGAMMQANPPPTNGFAISWTAAANTAYQVQYRTNLFLGNWQPLLNYTNNASTAKSATVYDTNAMSGQRFYRVSHP